MLLFRDLYSPAAHFNGSVHDAFYRLGTDGYFGCGTKRVARAAKAVRYVRLPTFFDHHTYILASTACLFCNSCIHSILSVWLGILAFTACVGCNSCIHSMRGLQFLHSQCVWLANCLNSCAQKTFVELEFSLQVSVLILSGDPRSSHSTRTQLQCNTSLAQPTCERQVAHLAGCLARCKLCRILGLRWVDRCVCRCVLSIPIGKIAAFLSMSVSHNIASPKVVSREHQLYKFSQFLLFSKGPTFYCPRALLVGTSL